MIRGLLIVSLVLLAPLAGNAAEPATFFEKHCYACHDSATKEAGLDLSALKLELADAENFARWVKIHDRIARGATCDPR